MQRWAELEEGPKLSGALAGLPAETAKRVADLRTTLQVLRIQQVGCSALFACAGPKSWPLPEATTWPG